MKAAAIVGWTGLGKFEDFESSVLHTLGARPKDIARVEAAVVVASDEPVAVARKLAYLPGVSYIAVGYRFTGTEGYLKTLSALAKSYLKGRTFKVSAATTKTETSAGDLVLAGTSEVLSSIRGAKVDEKKPSVRFRVTVGGKEGVVGAEIRTGPGGVPTGATWAACLVSGGERSSAMAWMASLSGLSVRLVHSVTGDPALRQVSRLYSDLSFRMDARRLEVVTIDGKGPPIGRLGGWLKKNRGTAFAGLKGARPESTTRLVTRFPNLSFPLSLVQDETIGATYRSLEAGRAVKEGPSFSFKALLEKSPYKEASFGGVKADSNAVLDALKGGAQ